MSNGRQNSSGHDEQSERTRLFGVVVTFMALELQVLPSVARLSNHVIRILGQVIMPCARSNLAQRSAS